MTDRYRSIVNMVIAGVSRVDIAKKHETSKQNIDRILSTRECQEYRKTRENERNSRSKKNSSDRLLMLVNKLLESAEHTMDNAVTDREKLQLADTVLSLTKLIPLPDNLNPLDSIPVVYVPETQSIAGFNADTLPDPIPVKKGVKTQIATLSPGGSEMPPPSQKLETKPKPLELYSEIDSEFEDIEEEEE